MTPGVHYKLYSFALSVTKEPSIAESIIADSITKTVQKIDPDRPEKFLPYLKMVVRNQSFDWLKRWKRQRSYLEETRGHSTIRSAFAEAVSREALRLFDEALERLTARERRAIMMRLVDQLAFSEIARRLRTTPGNARQLVFSARERLEGWLKYMQAV